MYWNRRYAYSLSIGIYMASNFFDHQIIWKSLWCLVLMFLFQSVMAGRGKFQTIEILCSNLGWQCLFPKNVVFFVLKSGLKISDEPDEDFQYDHNLTEILVEYASVVSALFFILKTPEIFCYLIFGNIPLFY